MDRSRALVTGAGSGIGAAAAKRLAAAGFGLVLAGRTEAALARTRDEVLAAQPEAVVHLRPFDVGRRDCELLVDDAAGALGGLDVAVNAAATFEAVDSLDLNADAWDRCLDVALRGSALVSAAAARQMAAAGGGGRIVLLASVSATAPMREAASYAAAKAGTVALAKAMAVDLAPLRICVNSVSPGWVDTPMNDYFDATPESLAGLNPQGRMASAAEIAELIAFLATDAPDFMTGADLVVDGGQLAGT